ncbi:MAG: acetyltransferase [Candidatus Xenobium sp.]|jgi:sugar O-acyltransferase (sialic acid O-acetyltransferase NeuD family)
MANEPGTGPDDVTSLIIVGAGNAAREVLQIAKSVNSVRRRWDIRGFLCDIDSNIEALTGGDYRVLGSIRDWRPQPDQEFLCAIADPHGRKEVVASLKDRGARFCTLIDPRARLADYCLIGEGVLIYPCVEIWPNVRIGDFALLQSSIAHDCVLGDYVTVSGGVNVCGAVRIESGAFIASGATIVPHKTIGSGAYVGAGSVVIRSVAANSRVFGNPARRLEV